MVNQIEPNSPTAMAANKAQGSQRGAGESPEVSLRLCMTAFIMLAAVSPIHTVLRPKPVMLPRPRVSGPMPRVMKACGAIGVWQPGMPASQTMRDRPIKTMSAPATSSTAAYGERPVRVSQATMNATPTARPPKAVRGAMSSPGAGSPFNAWLHRRRRWLRAVHTTKRASTKRPPAC